VLVSPPAFADRARRRLPDLPEPGPRPRGRAVELPPPIFFTPPIITTYATEVTPRRRAARRALTTWKGPAAVALAAGVVAVAAVVTRGESDPPQRAAKPKRAQTVEPRHGILEQQKTLRRRARPSPRVYRLLRWKRVPGAAYYDVQLYRGRAKIYEAWPRKPQLALLVRWRFDRRAHRLRRGSYSWYVWPGFGRPKTAHYGRVATRHTLEIP
jgi:hypothetical protein